jgi:hypothetical protein
MTSIFTPASCNARIGIVHSNLLEAVGRQGGDPATV